MRAKYFLYISLLGVFCQVAIGQIVNGGFEKYQSKGYSDPLPLFTNNFIAASLGNAGDTPFVSRRTNGVDVYAHIQNRVLDSNIQVGFLANSPFEKLQFVAGGTPFTGQPKIANVVMAYDIKLGDTAIILFYFKKAGNPVGITIHTITGSKGALSNVKITLDSIVAQPDSLLFVAFSGNQADPKLGSFLDISSILFDPGPAQLPNNLLNNWQDFKADDFDGWTSLNSLRFTTGAPQTVFASTDRYAGNTAARIETQRVPFDTQNSQITGFLTNGIIGEKGIEGGIALAANQHPTGLRGYYKYTTPANDSATVWVELSGKNTFTGKAQKHRFRLALAKTNSYKNFLCNLKTNDFRADSLLVTFFASNYDGLPADVAIGSSLVIDEVSLVTLPNAPLTLHLRPDTALCQGNRLQLSLQPLLTGGKAPFTYNWQPKSAFDSANVANATAIVNATTLFILTVTDATGASITGSVKATAWALPKPKLPADTLLQTGETIQLQAAEGFKTYLWSTADTSQSIIVRKAGSYSITVTDQNGCEGIDSVEISFKTDIASVQLGSAFNIYPNPIIDYLRFEPSMGSFIKYDILDLQGIRVKTGSVMLNQINVSSLKAGYYVISIHTTNGVYAKRFVKL